MSYVRPIDTMSENKNKERCIHKMTGIEMMWCPSSDALLQPRSKVTNEHRLPITTATTAVEIFDP